MFIFKFMAKIFAVLFLSLVTLFVYPLRLLEVSLTPLHGYVTAGFKDWFKRNNVGVTIGNLARSVVSAAGNAVPGGGAIADIINNSLLKPKPQEMAVVEAQVAVGKGIETPEQAVQKRDLPASGGLKLNKLDASQTNIGKPQDGSNLSKGSKDANLPWHKKMVGWMFPKGQKVYKMPGIWILVGIGVLVYFGWFSKNPWFKKKRGFRRW